MMKPNASTLSCSAATLVLCSAVAIANHGCDGPSVPPYDRTALIRETTDEVIVPTYQELAGRTATLHERTSGLCAEVTQAGLVEARDAWMQAFLAWNRTLPFQYGPATDDNLGPEMAFWPTRPATIEANLAAPDEVTALWIDGLGAGGKGLYAIEYLLFAGDDDAAILTALGEPRRCAYLDALTEHAARTSSRIVDGWTQAGGYAELLGTAGETGNVVFPAQLSALSVMLTGVLEAIQTTRVTELGTPLGRVGGSPQPDAVQCLWAPGSTAAMGATLESLRALWSSTPHSFDDHLRTRRPDMADQVLAQFDASRDALDALDEPWIGYVNGSDHIAGDAAYDRLRELEITLHTDVANTLAVGVMFTDNDGD